MAGYKYLISRVADPVLAVVIGTLAYSQWELKQTGPTLKQLVTERYFPESAPAKIPAPEAAEASRK